MKGTHKFAGLIPPNLISIIREGRCVLFVGAGLTAQAKTDDGEHLPTWGMLLRRMVEWCEKNGVDLRADKDELLKIIGKKRYLTVAQELQDRLGASLNTCISEIFHSGKIRPSEAHKLIPETKWVAVLTSNYDSLIEGAYSLNSGGVVPPVFSQNGISSALDCLRKNHHFVFKIHGDMNISGTIVLGNRDYSRLLYLSPAYRSFLETVFATYTVLFIGFSGDDPDLNDVTDKLSTVYERSIGQHFILLPSDALSPIERKRLLEDKRLDCIIYDEDTNHSQVVEFLKAIAIHTQSNAESTISPFKLGELAPRMFISGSYAQIKLLRELASLAQQVGFYPWFAESKINPGDMIQDVISQAIVDTDCMMVVMTEESARSSWVKFEFSRAFAASKTILPIRVGNVPVPFDIQKLFYLQIASPELKDEERQNIIKALKHLLDTIKGTK
jgi:nucleotide-binding universal stress UspA family protein